MIDFKYDRPSIGILAALIRERRVMRGFAIKGQKSKTVFLKAFKAILVMNEGFKNTAHGHGWHRFGTVKIKLHGQYGMMRNDQAFIGIEMLIGLIGMIIKILHHDQRRLGQGVSVLLALNHRNPVA